MGQGPKNSGFKPTSRETKSRTNTSNTTLLDHHLHNHISPVNHLSHRLTNTSNHVSLHSWSAQRRAVQARLPKVRFPLQNTIRATNANTISSHDSEDGAVIRNIDACRTIAQTVQTSLGPYGRNKIVINHLQKMILTNDAATILRELEVVHPAAKLLVMASQQQEAEMGDATNLSLCWPVSCSRKRRTS